MTPPKEGVIGNGVGPHSLQVTLRLSPRHQRATPSGWALALTALCQLLGACNGLADGQESGAGNVNPAPLPEGDAGGALDTEGHASNTGGAATAGDETAPTDPDPPASTTSAPQGSAAPSSTSSNGEGMPSATSPDAESPAPACDSSNIDPGPAPLRLLSREQYLNTLTQLFGDVPDVNSLFTQNRSAAEIGAGQGDVSQVELEDYERAAKLVAAFVVEGERLQQLVPCAAERVARDCARDFITQFGARAYRAPLGDETDTQRHLALYDVGAERDHRRGIELLLRGMLQSSRFLYRVELGVDEPRGAHAVALSGYEVAARLSYAFWNTLPDETLSTLAASGALTTPSEIAAQAERVLADPRAANAVGGFLETLVHLDTLSAKLKDPTLFPEWQAELPGALAQQSQRFFEYVLQQEAGSVEALLTSTTVFVNQDLNAYYAANAGAEFERLQGDPARVAGLLTLPALLANLATADESSPIYRGKFVREMLLCQTPPGPPAEIPAPPEVEPNVSTRERLRQHEVDPACSNCHSFMDPIGFGFEHYDALGRYRAEDGGKPVDARGEIIAAGDLNGEFNGVIELAAKLASSSQVQDCIARQYFRYALSRSDVKADACALAGLYQAFRDSGANLNALPLALVNSAAFTSRRPITPAAP